MKYKNEISFRLVAYTDPAGKFSPNAVRNGNEDNFYVDDDLTDGTTNSSAQDEIVHLGDKGMLMVVADGMGGMNAGEVASQIAIDTVKSAFSANSVSNSIVANVQTRQKYLEHVIKTADKNIKSEARKDRSHEGMGSTIIMAWLYGDELTISWCGDSRAYIFNEKSGIRLISQDHSYVQELVNKGVLTYDQTFDHPQNNIITRSLGDPTKEARPESKTLKVGKGDIILLCSDGLSGVLRDRKTYDANGQLLPEENLEDIIRANTSSMKACQEALWEAAERGGWYDNVTAILCQITDGPESKWSTNPSNTTSNSANSSKKRNYLFLLVGCVVMAAIVAAFFIGRGTGGFYKSNELSADSIPPIVVDSVSVDSVQDEDPELQSVQTSSVNDQASKVEPNQSVQEQIKKQAEEIDDTALKGNDLTKINKVESKDKNLKRNGLNEISKKLKQTTSDNPVSPENPNKKENDTHNPLNDK